MRWVEKSKTGLNWGTDGITGGDQGITSAMAVYIQDKTNTSFTAKHTIAYPSIARGINISQETILNGGKLKSIQINFSGYCDDINNTKACLWACGDWNGDGEIAIDDYYQQHVLSSISLTTTNTSDYILTSSDNNKFYLNVNDNYRFYFGGFYSSIKTFYWYFSDISFDLYYEVPYYTITASTSANGTITGAGEYENNTIITLNAIPDEGYKFSKWSDGNTEANRQLTVTEDLNLVAYFVPDKINNIFRGGALQPDKIFLGSSTEITSVYVGGTKVYG